MAASLEQIEIDGTKGRANLKEAQRVIANDASRNEKKTIAAIEEMERRFGVVSITRAFKKLGIDSELLIAQLTEIARDSGAKSPQVRLRALEMLKEFSELAFPKEEKKESKRPSAMTEREKQERMYGSEFMQEVAETDS